MTFFLCRGEKQSGPHSLVELKTFAKEQRISVSDLLWCDGWDGWRPVSEVPGVLTPELPAKLSVSEVPYNQAVRKRLDTSWEARIKERAQSMQGRSLVEAQTGNVRSLIRPPVAEIRQNPPSRSPIIAAAKQQHRVRKLFTPSGRVGRIRWLARTLMCLGVPVLIVANTLPIFAKAKQTEDQVLANIGNVLVIIAIIWYFVGLYLSLMNTFKRIHDLDLRGWWFIPLMLISFVFGIGFWLMLLIPGTLGENRFGPPEGKGFLD